MRFFFVQAQALKGSDKQPLNSKVNELACARFSASQDNKAAFDHANAGQ